MPGRRHHFLFSILCNTESTPRRTERYTRISYLHVAVRLMDDLSSPSDIYCSESMQAFASGSDRQHCDRSGDLINSGFICSK